MTWIPLALSRDVPVGTTRAAILDGAELVIWRGSAGTAQVWEDRCPHRGMRLSFGFVRENSLNCLYHGWRYEAGSQCLRIPAHPDLAVPPTIRARAFRAHEAAGLIWLQQNAEDPFPQLPPMTPLASLAVDASQSTILGALAAPPQAEVQMIAADIAGIPFYIGWHAVEPTKTMLHVSVKPEAEPGQAVSALYDLREQLESKVAA